MASWWLNIPLLTSKAQHTGALNVTLDSDGTLRRTPLLIRMNKIFTPSLSLKAYLVSQNLNANIHLLPHPLDPGTKWASPIQISNSLGEDLHQIPTNEKGELIINYAGPDKMFPHISAGEMLNQRPTLEFTQRVLNRNGSWQVESFLKNKKDFLKGKYLIFGETAAGIYDLRVTPFSENYPGVEVHANILDNLIRKDHLKTSPKEAIYMPLAVFLLGASLTFLMNQLGALMGLAVAFSQLMGIYSFDIFYLFPKGIVISLIFPMGTVFVIYFVLTFFQYFMEEKKRKRIKGTFQKYVSPEIVNEILKNSEKIQLGGVKQKMTVFFSDVRGFTTLSEKLDPKELSQLLNEYLTPMTEIVFSNKGTLDKYMGDALMAFFGAPIAHPKHGSQACFCALQQIEKLKDLKSIYREKNWPLIDIGIGINTGEMSVGNMGSETVRNYTVMGDSVNLASRLEGINKQYGTQIILSEFTFNEVRNDGFLARELDWVQVKGKTDPVRIFELMGHGENPHLMDKIKIFSQGFELYHQKLWSEAVIEFKKILELNPEDGPSLLYIRRCKEYILSPPPLSWNGVFTMTTK